MRTKRCGKIIFMTDKNTILNQKEREELKNKAVEKRESGDLLDALEMFQSVSTWDELNKNYVGLL